MGQLKEAGGSVSRQRDGHLLAGGFFYGSGEIDRVTDYETGLHGHLTFRGDVGTEDPLIMDERYLAAEVRGRGVTVLSACSHAGIVNACLSARTTFAGSEIDLVLGGYHLAGGAMEQRIASTIEDLDQLIAPKLVAPGTARGGERKPHCQNASRRRDTPRHS